MRTYQSKNITSALLLKGEAPPKKIYCVHVVQLTRRNKMLKKEEVVFKEWKNLDEQDRRLSSSILSVFTFFLQLDVHMFFLKKYTFCAWLSYAKGIITTIITEEWTPSYVLYVWSVARKQHTKNNGKVLENIFFLLHRRNEETEEGKKL